MMTKISLATISLILLITLDFWIFSKSALNLIAVSPLLSMAQITALFGFILISLSLFLSIKPFFLKTRVHHFIGALAFVLIINHPLFLIANVLPNFTLAYSYIIPGDSLSYSLGIISLYIMIFSFLFIAFFKIPYHIWKFTHQVLGVVFLLAGLHTLLIISDVSRYLPLKIWVILFFVLGITSFIYSVFLYVRFGPKHLFQVERIERVLDIINIYLKPLEKMFPFSPGQFIYASFDSKSVRSESHPFTISSAPEENLLRLSVKTLGDYTLKLASLETNTRVAIYGPFGNFGKEIFKDSETQIWVAGGIGVTPFLSILRTLTKNHITSEIHFFYCFSSLEAGVFLKEIRHLIKNYTNIHLYDWCSREKNRLSLKIFTPLIKNSQETKVFLCGPPKMMESLEKQFIFLGVPTDKIYSERFDL